MQLLCSESLQIRKQTVTTKSSPGLINISLVENKYTDLVVKLSPYSMKTLITSDHSKAVLLDSITLALILTNAVKSALAS